MPATVYIALGAVAAAIITGLISLVNLVIAKDQEISRFRQSWIDALRTDLAEILRHCSEVANRHNILIKHQIPVDAKEFVETVAKSSGAIQEIHTRIQLRLNPVEHRALLSLLKKMENVYSEASKDMGPDMLELMDPIIQESQAVLKREWVRVKEGEMTYRAAKYLSLLAIAVFLVWAYLYVPWAQISHAGP